MGNLKYVSLFVLLAGCSLLEKSSKREFAFETQWIRPTITGDYLGPRRAHTMAPLVDKDTVYQGNALDGIVAYEKLSGKPKWKINIVNGVSGGAQVDGDRLYFAASDGQVYCANSNTGQILWAFPTRTENLATPLIKDQKLYFLSGNNVVYALDAMTGKQLWLYNRTDTTTLSIRGGSQPLLYNNNLVVGFSDGFLVALNIKDGSLVWERQLGQSKRFKDVEGSPVGDDKYIYASSYDGALYCLSQGDGQIVWRIDEGSHTAVTIEGDTLYYSTSSGKVLALDKKTGKQNWSRAVGAGVATQPIYYNGMLVYGESQGPVNVVDARSGEIISRYFTGRGLTATPYVDSKSGDLIVFSNEANLFRVKMGYKEQWMELPWQRKSL